jgi:trehalose-6-phosphate synthase
MAQSISSALVMPAGERRERWQTMMAKLKARPIQAWCSDFLGALKEARAAAPLQSAATIHRLPLRTSRGERSVAGTY